MNLALNIETAPFIVNITIREERLKFFHALILSQCSLYLQPPKDRYDMMLISSLQCAVCLTVHYMMEINVYAKF